MASDNNSQKLLVNTEYINKCFYLEVATIIRTRHLCYKATEPWVTQLYEKTAFWLTWFWHILLHLLLALYVSQMQEFVCSTLKSFALNVLTLSSWHSCFVSFAKKVKVRVAVNFRRLFAFVLSMMQLLSHCIDLLSRLNVAQVFISSQLTKQSFAWSLFFKMEIFGNALTKFKFKKFSEWLCKPQLRFVRM